MVIGPNGSGKSTLLAALLGHVPSRGTIAWNDKPLAKWKSRALARVVAYLPQSPRSDVGQRVRDVLAIGRAPYWGAFGLESSADEAVVSEVAEILSLTHLLTTPMDQLSGGQRQRVFIGRALAQEPTALLLDEPSTFLDLKHQVDLMRLLRDLARARNLAVLMASHDLNLAGAFADRLMVLKEGAVAAAGEPREVLNAELLSEVYGLSLRATILPGGQPMISPRL